MIGLCKWLSTPASAPVIKGRTPKTSSLTYELLPVRRSGRSSEYVDRATGKHSDREQFKRLFEDASRRKFDLVVFWSLDRFSREGVLETLHHLQRLAQYGVGYRSFTEQYLDSCGIFKDAVLSILATIAKQERIRISERVHAGLAKARKQGRIGGRPRLILSHAKVLAMSQEGCTIREIAEEMRCSPASVHRILKSHHREPGNLVPV